MSAQQRRYAQRVRAGVIGLLECCRCTYPVEHHETVSGHDEGCPAHGMTISARAVSKAGFFMVALDVETPSDVVDAIAQPDVGRPMVGSGDVIRVEGADGAWERCIVESVKGGAIRFLAADGAKGSVSTSDEGAVWRRCA